MPMLIALLIAVLVMLVVYDGLPVATSVRNRQFDVIRGNAPADAERAPLPLWRVALLPLNQVLDRIYPSAWRESVRHKLYWANFAGSWLGWNEVELWTLSVVLAVVAAVVFMSDPLIALMSAAIAGVAPTVLLGNVARQTERAIVRELPDALYLLAAMVSANIVLPDALRRLTEYRGVLARWLAIALARSHGGNMVAAIRAEAEQSGLPRLMALATKLELIEARGAAGSSNLLRALADDQAREYEREAERRAKELGNELLVPMMLFFFMPYLIVIGAPLLANILSLFTPPR